MSRKIVVLNPGHGGKDPGAVGNGIKEKDIVLSVSLKIGKILEENNIKVFYSRTTDVFTSLKDISKYSNSKKADVFISIHANGSTNKKAQGVETFSSPGSSKGRSLARGVQDSILKEGVYTKDRGIKTANFSVIGKRTIAPSILVEIAFISNIEDSNILKKQQKEIASSISKGILKNLGIKHMKSNSLNVGIYYARNKKYNNKKGVVKLQNDLIKLGYSVGIYGCDGLFGKDTEKAVKKFQYDNNLKVDGSAGNKTLNMINKILIKYLR